MSLTIAIIGTTNHRLMEFALEKTIKSVPYDKIKVFSDKKINLSAEYEFFELPEKFGLVDYCDFLLKSLHHYIDTDHVLSIQYDGFAVNKEYWSDDFLNYDYIGSLMCPSHPPLTSTLQKIGTDNALKTLKEKEWRNGGGGLTLRSKKFLVASASEDFSPYVPCADGGLWSCEDYSISYYHREMLENNYDIKFAPVSHSLNFSVEITTGYDFSLGFHGWQNIPLFLSEDEVIFYMYNLGNNARKRKEFEMFLGFLIYKGYKKAYSIFHTRTY
jgi:hypothetical protein